MSKELPNTYTTEFRASAVKLANESDKPISHVTHDLGINVNTLARRLRIAAQSRLAVCL